MAAKRQCAGTVTNPKAQHVGSPCRRWAVNGSDFCAVHGGSNKNLLSDPRTLQNRCTAKAHKTGEQCRNQAIRGGVVCKYHGGAAGHVKKKARERLMEMVEPALVQLTRIMEQPATSDSDRLRAVQMVLDRTGYGPGHHVEVEVRPWEAAMTHIFKDATGIIKDVPEDMRAEVDAMRRSQNDYSEVIEDAELVEDEESNVTRITPARGVNERATVRGSSDPPRPRK